MTKPVALITGCTKGGIGYSFCEQFAKNGYQVYATARRVESMEGLEELGCKLLRLDVTDNASIKSVVDQVITEAGQIDILINNAGRPGNGALMDIDLDDARKCVETNVFGVLAVTRAVATHMAKRGSGKIANIGSVVGYASTPWAGVYAFSKAAVHSMTDALRLELAPLGIQVILVAPGGVTSNFGNNAVTTIDIPEGSFYQSVANYILARANMSQGPGSTPTDVFTAHVTKRLLRRSPPSYVTFGSNSFFFLMFYYLPFFVKDYFFSRRMGTIYVKRIAN
ncbi:hypothetical protein VTP01DRAFT_8280 [Rhizomucor pusillus]|uniref:uncharacterized protein n=1 Tax=Rhizomucor pusillus TaxID=4840 RepID=UPI00374266BC